MIVNPETNRAVIQVNGFRNFIIELGKALKEGFTLTDCVVHMPFGFRFCVEVYKAGEEPSAQEIVEDVIDDDTESIAVEDEITETTVPDWEALDAMVLAGNKDAIEAYCEPFGIDLNKRKSPANMLLEFKEFVGAV